VGGVDEEINAGWVAESKTVCICERYRDGRAVTCSCIMIPVFAAGRGDSVLPGGGVGGEVVCEGIDAGWVTEDKIVCIWWQIFVIGRGKGCRDKFVLREDPDCLLRCEEVVGIESGT